MKNYYHWIIPAAGEEEYVPDAEGVAGILRILEEAGWIKIVPAAPYVADGPFYYSVFPGIADPAQSRRYDSRYDASIAAEPVIEASHCRSVTVTVNDVLLVAPTVEAAVSCQRCKRSILSNAEGDVAHRVPEGCESCGSVIERSELARLPLFRVAIVIELWYPPTRPDLSVAPELLRSLGEETGRTWREARQSVD